MEYFQLGLTWTCCLSFPHVEFKVHCSTHTHTLTYTGAIFCINLLLKTGISLIFCDPSLSPCTSLYLAAAFANFGSKFVCYLFRLLPVSIAISLSRPPSAWVSYLVSCCVVGHSGGRCLRGARGGLRGTFSLAVRKVRFRSYFSSSWAFQPFSFIFSVKVAVKFSFWFFLFFYFFFFFIRHFFVDFLELA